MVGLALKILRIADFSKTKQTLWKWCGVRIASTTSKKNTDVTTLAIIRIHLGWMKLISVPTEKGERENDSKRVEK